MGNAESVKDSVTVSKMNWTNTKRTAVIAGAACLAAFANAQSDLNSRVFTYDGSPATNGAIDFSIDGASFGPAGPVTAGTNSITNEGPGGASFGLDLEIKVQTFIYVSGSFDADYTVTGYGSASDTSPKFSDVEIRTNRSLTITTTGFSELSDEANPTNHASPGSVTYSLSAFQGFPYIRGSSQISPLISGSDQSFSGKSVMIQVSDLPNSGQATLRMARVLSINSGATGATTYRAKGTLILTVS
jgi:hypothetical protein